MRSTEQKELIVDKTPVPDDYKIQPSDIFTEDAIEEGSFWHENILSERSWCLLTFFQGRDKGWAPFTVSDLVEVWGEGSEHMDAGQAFVRSLEEFLLSEDGVNYTVTLEFVTTWHKRSFHLAA